MLEVYVVVEFNRAFLSAMLTALPLLREKTTPRAPLSSRSLEIADGGHDGEPRQSVPQTVRRAPTLSLARFRREPIRSLGSGYLHCPQALESYSKCRCNAVTGGGQGQHDFISPYPKAGSLVDRCESMSARWLRQSRLWNVFAQSVRVVHQEGMAREHWQVAERFPDFRLEFSNRSALNFAI